MGGGLAKIILGSLFKLGELKFSSLKFSSLEEVSKAGSYKIGNKFL